MKNTRNIFSPLAPFTDYPELRLWVKQINAPFIDPKLKNIRPTQESFPEIFRVLKTKTIACIIDWTIPTLSTQTGNFRSDGVYKHEAHRHSYYFFKSTSQMRNREKILNQSKTELDNARKKSSFPKCSSCLKISNGTKRVFFFKINQTCVGWKLYVTTTKSL